jgi:hypothetical protein
MSSKLGATKDATQKLVALTKTLRPRIQIKATSNFQKIQSNTSKLQKKYGTNQIQSTRSKSSENKTVVGIELITKRLQWRCRGLLQWL